MQAFFEDEEGNRDEESEARLRLALGEINISTDERQVLRSEPLQNEADDSEVEALQDVIAFYDEVTLSSDLCAKLYYRDVASFELLTREGEIVLAKRIEEGLGQVQASLAGLPKAIEVLLEWYDQHLKGRRRLSEVVAGFTDVDQAIDAAAFLADQAALSEPLLTQSSARSRKSCRFALPLMYALHFWMFALWLLLNSVLASVTKGPE